MYEKDMENIQKEMFRKIVKEKVLEATFIYLKEKQKSHSKKGQDET